MVYLGDGQRNGGNRREGGKEWRETRSEVPSGGCVTVVEYQGYGVPGRWGGWVNSEPGRWVMVLGDGVVG